MVKLSTGTEVSPELVSEIYVTLKWFKDQLKDNPLIFSAMLYDLKNLALNKNYESQFSPENYALEYGGGTKRNLLFSNDGQLRSPEIVIACIKNSEGDEGLWKAELVDSSELLYRPSGSDMDLTF